MYRIKYTIKIIKVTAKTYNIRYLENIIYDVDET